MDVFNGPNKACVVNGGALYVDNYMVRGYSSEHEKLGEKPVPLNMGIERVKRGIVVVDREMPSDYLNYMNILGLFDPTQTAILNIGGNANTMIKRLLDQVNSSAIFREKVKELINKLGICHIDTFGVSEFLHRDGEEYDYLKLSRAVDLPVFYNPLIAKLLMNKSFFCKWMDELIETEELGDLVRTPKGIMNLNINNVEPEKIGAFLAQIPHKDIIIKKDVATFNKGNKIIPKKRLLKALNSKDDLKAFLLEECSFLEDGSTFSLEEYIPHKHTMSSLLEIHDDGTIIVKSMQDQVYHDEVLLGFRSPMRNRKLADDLYKINQYIGKFLRQHGYVGHIVPDFIVDENGKIVIVEINMRRGGSSVPQNIAARLNRGDSSAVGYISQLIRAKAGIAFEQLIESLGLYNYDFKTNTGVVLAEAGRFNETGMCTMVAIRDLENKQFSGAEQILLRARKKLESILR